MNGISDPHAPAPLFAALYLPRVQLQAAMRDRWTGQHRPPVAVLDSDLALRTSAKEDEYQGLLLHATEAAERRGVYAGMNPSQALARCRDLTLLYRDLEAERQAQEDLQACAAEWTPYFEATEPGTYVLDFTRVRGIAEDPEECARRMYDWLAERNWAVRIGFASNPDLASLAAQAAQPLLVLSAGVSSAAFIHELPLSALHPSPALAELLHLWGLHTLGQFAKLPRAEVAARLGQEGVLLWDLAAGGRERLLDWVRPRAVYRQVMELEHPMESLEPLLFILRRMLETLCRRLAESWLVATTVRVELGFDDKTRYHQELRAAEPTRDADLLLRLLHTHLDGFTSAAPIVRVEMELTSARPNASQDHLFERRLQDPNRFAETLAQLEALLGRGQVGRAQLLPSRRMDAFEVLPFTEPARRTARASAPAPALASLPPTSPPGLPLRRFRPSREVRVLLEGGRPIGLQLKDRDLPVEDASGPWLLSGDWWDRAAWEREVWEVAAGDGCLYQLTKEGEHWLLEGVFG